MSDQLINQSLGRYQINSRLGAGGMGSVYKGSDPELDRDIAIKIMHPHLAQQTSRGSSRSQAERVEALSACPRSYCRLGRSTLPAASGADLACEVSRR